MEQNKLKQILETIKANIENNKYHDLESLLEDTSRLLYDHDGEVI